MSKFSVLYPVKNRSCDNLYNLLPQCPHISEILIMDSSDTAANLIDLARVFDFNGVRVRYTYESRLNLAEIRAMMALEMNSPYGLFLDSDVVLGERFNLGAYLSLLTAGAPFVAFSVINYRGFHKPYRGSHEFLAQFADSVASAATEAARYATYPDCLAAGMYALGFKNPAPDHYSDFVSYTGALLPSEDIAFCRFLTLLYGRPGKLNMDQIVFHLGRTNHDAWSFINNRRVEQALVECEDLDGLYSLMKDLGRPEYISALQNLYQSS